MVSLDLFCCMLAANLRLQPTTSCCPVLLCVCALPLQETLRVSGCSSSRQHAAGTKQPCAQHSTASHPLLQQQHSSGGLGCSCGPSFTSRSFPAGLMRSADTVLTAKTNQTLQDIIPMLNKVSGLPVVDASDRVIGVISRKVSPATDSCSCCNTLLHAHLLPGGHPSHQPPSVASSATPVRQLAVAAMHQAELRSDTCPAWLACVPLRPAAAAAGHHPRAPC